MSGIIDTLPSKGFPYNKVTLQLFSDDGALKHEQTVENLVVDDGLAVIADRMQGTPTLNAMSHMAVGSSSQAPADADTDLITIVGSRVALDSTTIVTTNVTNDSLQYVCTFGAGVSTGALQEAGIFNAATLNDMLCRTTFATINKGASDSLVITWTVVIA